MHLFGKQSTRIKDLSNYWGHVSDSKNTLIKKGRDYQRILADAENQINREDFLQEKLNRLKTLKNEIYNLEKENSKLIQSTDFIRN